VSDSPRKKSFRLFFATDVHGSEVTFTKFLNSAAFYKADVLVLGGDITGKMIIPVIDLGNGSFAANLLGQELTSSSGMSLDDILRRIKRLGFYPFQTAKEDWTKIDADPERYDELFRRLALERLQGWASLAEKKLAGKNVAIYVTGGNDDPRYVEDFLKQQQFMIDPEDKIVTVARTFEMLSIGYSNPTPWKTPRECPEEELQKKIDGLVSELSNPASRCIFNIHVPPYESTIDTAPMVDGSTTPPRYVLRDGMPQMINAGSTAVRAAVERYQPMLALHGHIHESRGVIKIGKTICINPGSEYAEGVLRGVVVNMDSNGVKGYQLTSG
jgi:Icc-related predicted phosphoesterase